MWAAKLAGTPAEDGVPKVASPEPAGDQQVVGVAVVAAGELDHRVTPGDAAGQPDRGHYRLGAGGHEADHLQVGYGADHPLGELDLRLAGGAEGEPVGGGLPDRLDDRRVGVAEDQRSPRADVVEVASRRRRR